MPNQIKLLSRKWSKNNSSNMKIQSTAKTSILVIVLVSLVINSIESGPSAQQEHELMLLDALSRKQIGNNLNSISTTNTNNYESNAIMDMLGRSMLKSLFLYFYYTFIAFFHFIYEESELLFFKNFRFHLIIDLTLTTMTTMVMSLRSLHIRCSHPCGHNKIIIIQTVFDSKFFTEFFFGEQHTKVTQTHQVEKRKKTLKL